MEPTCKDFLQVGAFCLGKSRICGFYIKIGYLQA